MRLAHWIDGKPTHAASGRWREVFDPARGEPFAEVADGDARDVDAAVAAAQRAFPAWAALPNDQRAHWLEALAAATSAGCAKRPAGTVLRMPSATAASDWPDAAARSRRIWAMRPVSV